MQACRVLCNLKSTRKLINGAAPHSFVARFATSPPGDPAGVRADSVSSLLQKTVSLLPRTLSTSDGASGPGSFLFWSNILEESIAELSSDKAPSKATIAVCGFDKWAGSHDLVTALLEDPFSSDPTYSDILRNRWKNTPSRINIEFGKPSAFAGELSSPSDWLQRFPHAIQLTELPDLLSLFGISDETDSLLLNSDVLVLVSNPVVTPLSDLALRAKYLLNKPNTILVLTSGSVSDAHHQFVSRKLSDMGCQPGCILFVVPKQALDAATALQNNTSSPSAIDSYQRDTLESRISTITAAINKTLSPESPLKASLKYLRQNTVLLQAHGALSASVRTLETTEKEVEFVASKVDALSFEVQTIRENARREILGEGGAIEKALSLGTKEINTLLRSLTFWKTIWRVDEIGTLVSAAIQGQWCKGLENELVLHTGRLESTKKELSVSAFGLISASSSASLRSLVLENQLQQLKRLPTLALTPNSLTWPIHDRRTLLVQHTTTKLHREAQSAVVGAFGGILSGVGVGWWLAFGEHILNLGAGAETGTAIGAGALLAVSGIRWAVGRWERAKQRWLQDSGRVGEGLARDLQSTIQRTVDDNVTIVAWTACKGVQELVDRRRGEIRRLREELDDLDTELQGCAQLPTTRTGQRPPSGVDEDTK